MYTDEQLCRVAEWLGYRITEEVGETCLRDKDGWGFPLDGFAGWLLSPEGRVATEDKFIEVRAICFCVIDRMQNIPVYRIVQCHGLESACETMGEGDTPAEAWLSAAVKYCEVEHGK